MKPAPFNYISPATIEEAAAALREHGYGAKLLAGGQSLIPTMNFRLAQPAVLIDINNIKGLDFIRQDVSGELRIGALVRHYQLENDPLVAVHAPLITAAMAHVAHPQIRNRGTVGGSIAHADPAAELPAVMLALGARFRLQNGRSSRWVSASDFFLGLFVTALADDDILVEIAIPPMQAGMGFGFEEIARRHGDFALAGVAVMVQMARSTSSVTAARIVYINAGEIPMLAQKASQHLVGKSLTAAVMDEAVTIAQTEIEPTGDIHATVEFKRHLAKVLTIRALKSASATEGGAV